MAEIPGNRRNTANGEIKGGRKAAKITEMREGVLWSLPEKKDKKKKGQGRKEKSSANTPPPVKGDP